MAVVPRTHSIWPLNSSDVTYARGIQCRRLALNANSSAVTAIGNDYGYEEVFARQLQALATPGDVAVAISTSGNSPNVTQAVISARRLGLFTIGLTGAAGGRLRGLVDVLIAVPSQETPRIQECHILAGHALCDAVEQAVASEYAARSQDQRGKADAAQAGTYPEVRSTWLR